MTKHVHTPAHVGEIYEVCECGAVRKRFLPGMTRPDPWHACKLCSTEPSRK